MGKFNTHECEWKKKTLNIYMKLQEEGNKESSWISNKELYCKAFTTRYEEEENYNATIL